MGGRGRGRGRGGGRRDPPPALFGELQQKQQQNASVAGAAAAVTFDARSDVFPRTGTLVERNAVKFGDEYRLMLCKSAFYAEAKVAQDDDFERYSDKYRSKRSARPTLRQAELNLEFFPLELQGYIEPTPLKANIKFAPGLQKSAVAAAPGKKIPARRGNAATTSADAMLDPDIDEELRMELERLEQEGDTNDAQAEENDAEKVDAQKEGQESEPDVEQEPEEDDDDGNDYMESYFDNGEGFDDDIDEGGGGDDYY